MKKLSMSIAVTTLAASTVAACGGVARDSEQTTAESEISAETRSLWQPGGKTNVTTIPLCFPGALATDAQYATFRTAVTEAARDWENAADGRIRWTPIPACGSGSQIRLEKMDGGGSTHIGQNQEPIKINGDSVNDYARLKEIAWHELGHKLGFTHEQVHPDSSCDRRQTDRFLFWEFETDTKGQSFFPYDPNSAMNYCQPVGYGLSAGDRDGAQRFYGGNTYWLAPGTSFWLRASIEFGPFLNRDLGLGSSMASRFWFKNVTRPGEQIAFGQQVTIATDNGKYLAILPPVRTYAQDLPARAGLSNTPFTWDVGGYRSSGLVGINDPVAFSTGSTSRYFLSVSKDAGPRASGAITIGLRTIASSSKTPPAPPANTTYIFRVLGPGPDFPVPL
jgi:hypothetical protein